MQALRELPSPGKSGSVFFLSDDDRRVLQACLGVLDLLGAQPWAHGSACLTFSSRT